MQELVRSLCIHTQTKLWLCVRVRVKSKKIKSRVGQRGRNCILSLTYISCSIEPLKCYINVIYQTSCNMDYTQLSPITATELWCISKWCELFSTCCGVTWNMNCCQFLRSVSSTSRWGRHGKKQQQKKNTFSLPVFLSGVLYKWAQHVCTEPFLPSHTLWDISRKWFMLNSVCQICQLIKWSFALSMYFSVMTFHLILQVST